MCFRWLLKIAKTRIICRWNFREMSRSRSRYFPQSFLYTGAIFLSFFGNSYIMWCVIKRISRIILNIVKKIQFESFFRFRCYSIFLIELLWFLWEKKPDQHRLISDKRVVDIHRYFRNPSSHRSSAEEMQSLHRLIIEHSNPFRIYPRYKL